MIKIFQTISSFRRKRPRVGYLADLKVDISAENREWSSKLRFLIFTLQTSQDIPEYLSNPIRPYLLMISLYVVKQKWVQTLLVCVHTACWFQGFLWFSMKFVSKPWDMLHHHDLHEFHKFSQRYELCNIAKYTTLTSYQYL